MPRPEQLPESLNDFAYRNAVQVDSSQNFETDVGRLIRAMERILEGNAEADALQGATAVAEVIEATPQLIPAGDPVRNQAPPSEPVPGLSAEIEGLRATNAGLEAKVAALITARKEDAQAAKKLRDEVAAALLRSAQDAKTLTEQLAQAQGAAETQRQRDAAALSEAQAHLANRDAHIAKLEQQLAAQGRSTDAARPNSVSGYRIAVVVVVVALVPMGLAGVTWLGSDQFQTSVQVAGQRSQSAEAAVQRGRDAEKQGNFAEAMRFYRTAADQGSADAEYRIGHLYDYANGTSPDYGQAMIWYRKAADRGNAEAQYGIGVLYEYGQGVPPSVPQARYWYKLAADQGFAKANALATLPLR